MREYLWSLAKKVLFRLDAEAVHTFMLRMVLLLGGRKGGVLPFVSASRLEPAPSPVTLWGLEFSSRLGLAAGFDKDGEIAHLLPYLGFGFAELGTVTPRPQPGNDRPRLFRKPSDAALFNRMGFNNLGAENLARRLSAIRPGLPPGFRLGVNVGKNKDTPLERAADDYRLAVARFEGLADYLVLNVSSPNTPGLRSLQTEAALAPIIEAVLNEVRKWRFAPPVLLKLAPEIRNEALRGILELGERLGIAGWVLTNTVGGVWPRQHGQLQGGWSGGPATEASRASLIEARAMTKLPIISVGGILTPEEAAERLRLGAQLVQIYSGWIFQGPTFPARINERLL